MRNWFFVFCLSFAGLVSAADRQVPDATAARAMVEGRCAECHSGLMKGDPAAIYTRTDRRVHESAELAKQIHACTGQMKAPLFPEEEAHLATYLNTRYYQFKQ